MGLLDDLRKKTSELQENERSLQDEQVRAERCYREIIQPSLKHIFSHLRELTQHLNYLQQELNVDYIVNADDLGSRFNQQDYQLELDSTEHTRQVTLRFKCVGPRAITYRLSGGQELQKHVDFLNQSGLIYSSRPHKDDRHKVISSDFEIRAYIPISFVFEADIKNSQIKLHVSNFPQLGFRSYNIPLTTISEQFYEDIGRYIIREKENFLRLDISEEEKKRIQSMVADEMSQRQIELNNFMEESTQIRSDNEANANSKKRNSAQ